MKVGEIVKQVREYIESPYPTKENVQKGVDPVGNKRGCSINMNPKLEREII